MNYKIIKTIKSVGSFKVGVLTDKGIIKFQRKNFFGIASEEWYHVTQLKFVCISLQKNDDSDFEYVDSGEERIKLQIQDQHLIPKSIECSIRLQEILFDKLNKGIEVIDESEIDFYNTGFDDKNYQEVAFHKKERKYPIGGYAPGNYCCSCCSCKKDFMGDKRSVQCESCAVESIKNEEINGYTKLSNKEDIWDEVVKKYNESEDYKKIFDSMGTYVLFQWLRKNYNISKKENV